MKNTAPDATENNPRDDLGDWEFCDASFNPDNKPTQHEDTDYIHALIQHQRSRMEQLKTDLEKAKEVLRQEQEEATRLEQQNVAGARRKSDVFIPCAQDVQQLRVENRKLQVDIQLLYREIDLRERGGVPPAPQQNFYQTSVFPTGPPVGPPVGHTAPLHVNIQPHPVPPPMPAGPPPHAAPPPPRTAPPRPEDPQWSCSACTYLNHPLIQKCEMCDMPRVRGNNELARSKSQPLGRTLADD